MIRLARCTQAAKAGHYFRLHLESGDDASSPVRTNFALRPRWHGTAIQEVGLSYLAPTAKHLTRLGSGLHPTKPGRLAPSINRKRAYYDLTIAGTKTVSLAALLRPEHATAQNVLQAHLVAVEKVAGEIGRLIHSQNPKGPPITGWLGVTFHHTHTREGDPHLHSHVVLPNVGKNAAGQWRAVQVKIAGVARQRLELCYGHELARQLRKAGLGDQLVMRKNGLPELRDLRAFRPFYARARTSILEAAKEADSRHAAKRGSTAKKNPPVAPTGRSGLPLHPRRFELRRRQKLADRLRKPKPRGADDPRQLYEESRRWLHFLTNRQVREVDAVLSLRGSKQLAEGGKLGRKLAGMRTPSALETVWSARAKIPVLAAPTRALLFKLAVVESAGRHDWEDLRQGMRDYLREVSETTDAILAFCAEDSERIEAARIAAANRGASEDIPVASPSSDRLTHPALPRVEVSPSENQPATTQRHTGRRR